MSKWQRFRSVHCCPWREFNWSSREDIRHWEIQILIYFQSNNLVLTFSLKSLASIRPFAKSCHCCVKVPGQDCSPKPCKASEGGKQKADGYPRAESLPECAGPWLPWQHRAQQALQGALGPSELICAGDPQQGTEQMNQSGSHLSGARHGSTPTSSSSFLKPWKLL